MNAIASYRRAHAGLDAMLASVHADRWDIPSPCARWTVRDVAGHVVWAQDQLRCWIAGDTYGGASLAQFSLRGDN